MITDTNDVVALAEPTDAKTLRKAAAKRKAASELTKAMTKALEAVEKLEARNHDAAEVLRGLSELWLSPDASRKRGDAEIALNHFDSALATFRKSLAAM